MAATNGKANGVFIDGVSKKSFKNQLTEQEAQDWNNVILHNQ